MKLKTFILSFIAFAMVFNACEKVEDATGSTIEVSSSIDEATTWKSNNTYIIGGNLSVKADLTIEPGTVIKFKNDARITVAYSSNVYAKIIANGTADKPIRFTSNAPSPAAGNWKNIAFYGGSENSELSHCIFEFGGGEATYGTIYINSSIVNITNCQFKNLSNSAIVSTSNGSFGAFTLNTFTSIEKHAVEIDANKAHTLGMANLFSVNVQYGIKISNNMNISGDFTWLAHTAPYIISETIHIGGDGNGVNLTINPGTVLKFTANTGFDIAYSSTNYGRLVAKGTSEMPIVFTSNVPSSQPGDYKGLKFYGGSDNSEFEYCTFEYAGKESYGGIYIDNAAVKFAHCQFKNMLNNAIKLINTGRFIEFTQNSFSNNATHQININSNYVHTIGAGNQFNSETNGILVNNNLSIEGQYTWLNQGTPYVIADDIRVGSAGNGVTLTIAAGTVLKFNDGKGFMIAYPSTDSGKIIAEGTESNPIVFTSSKPVPQKGDWDGLYFYGGSTGSSFNHVEILYAGSNTSYGAFMLSQAGNNTITLTNSRIGFSNGHGITVDSNSSVDYSTVSFNDNNGNNYHVR